MLFGLACVTGWRACVGDALAWAVWVACMRGLRASVGGVGAVLAWVAWVMC